MAEASREQAATGVRASIGPPNIGKPTLTENDVRRGLAITWYVAWMGRDIERMPCGDFLPRITGREIIKAYENDRSTIVHVAFLECEVVGYVWYRLGPEIIVVERIVVDPVFQRLGVGSALFSHVRGKVDRKRHAVIVNVHERDFDSLQFFKSQAPLASRLIRGASGSLHDTVRLTFGAAGKSWEESADSPDFTPEMGLDG